MMTNGREGIAAELLLVRARNQSYCLDVESIREIVPATSFLFNEGSDTPFGWIEVDGETIPVHALSWLVQGVYLGNPRRGRIIVIEGEEGCRGLLVDGFDALAPQTPVRFYPLPDALRGPRSGYLRGVAYLGAQPLLYLAIERLLPLSPARRQAGNEGESSGAYRGEQGICDGDVAITFASIDHPESSVPVELAIGVELVCEFLDGADLVAVHEAGKHLPGIIDWRGRPVPMLNVYHCLGVDDRVESRSPGYVVVRTGEEGELLALPSTDDPRVQKLSGHGKLPSGLFGMPSGLIRGVTRGARSFIIVVEPAAFLDSQQLRRLQPAVSE